MGYVGLGACGAWCWVGGICGYGRLSLQLGSWLGCGSVGLIVMCFVV